MIHSTKIHLRLALCAATASLLLAGCGLAETAVVAGDEAASAAEQAKKAKELEEKVQRDIDAAQQAAKEARDKAEAETQ